MESNSKQLSVDVRTVHINLERDNKIEGWLETKNKNLLNCLKRALKDFLLKYVRSYTGTHKVEYNFKSEELTDLTE